MMKKALLSIITTLTGLFSIGLSLVASPVYLGLVSLALGCGLVSLVAGIVMLAIFQEKTKWTILFILVPVAVFSIDNLGRLLMCLGLGGFRILI